MKTLPVSNSAPIIERRNLIRIRPVIEHESRCPHCAATLRPTGVLWQGIHVCAMSRCPQCETEIIEDLPIGHAIQTPFKVDLKANRLFGDPGPSRRWFGEPLLRSLSNPEKDEVEFRVESFRDVRQAVILNCLDFVYGHALLKLLNADWHLRRLNEAGQSEAGLIVMIQPFLRWLVPDGVAEIWTASTPLSQARSHFPRLHQRIARECERFDAIYLSAAHSHPVGFDITNFSRVARHDFSSSRFRITFIWREDRPWWKGDLTRRAARRIKPLRVLLLWQNFRVRRLFSRLREHFPEATFTVAGLGQSTRFPAWIDDQRVVRFDGESERKACGIYAESRLALGVHGSNMLLPSAHAGIVIDLMPNDRWKNIGQDALYQNPAGVETEDARMTSLRRQYLPLDISTRSLFYAVKSLIECYSEARSYFQIEP